MSETTVIPSGPSKMRRDNPAIFECPKGSGGIHNWKRNPQTRRAICQHCGLELNQKDAAEVYGDHDQR